MSEVIDINRLLGPIPGDLPSGRDAAQEPEYESIRDELDKLTNPNSDGLVDWFKIEALATTIITTQSKDFLVAVWLASAWIETRGVSGLEAGFILIAELIRDYWANAYPSLKRIRGRRNSLDWWQIRVKDWLSKTEIPPVTAASHQAMLDALMSIDKDLSEFDPEFPPLAELIGLVKRFDVLPEPEREPEPEPEPGAIEGSDTAGQAEEFGPSSTETAYVRASLASIPSQSAIGPVAVFSGGSPVISGLGDIPNAMAPVQDYLTKVSDAIKAIDPVNPLVVHLSRFAARASIITLPPAQGQVTRIPCPQMAGYEAVCKAGNPESIAEFCESRVGSTPFWLDLDMQAARAYAAMGAKAAGLRQTLIEDVLFFIQRLPGVECLKFDDGTPFACSETRAWLIACQEERAGGGAVSDAFSKAKKQATDAFNDGNIESAMSVYQNCIAYSRSARDRFRARLSLVGLLMDSRSDIDPMPFIAPLLEESGKRSLADWEPELVLAALLYKMRALKQKMMASASRVEDVEASSRLAHEVEEVMQQIALLDFVEAVRQL